MDQFQEFCHFNSIEVFHSMNIDSFHSFKSSLISFNNVLYFLEYKSYISIVNFIPKFILFYATLNEISLIFGLSIASI